MKKHGSPLVFCGIFWHRRFRFCFILQETSVGLQVVLACGTVLNVKRDQVLLRWQGEKVSTRQPTAQLDYWDTHWSEHAPNDKTLTLLQQQCGRQSTYAVGELVSKLKPPPQMECNWWAAVVLAGLLQARHRFCYKNHQLWVLSPEETRQAQKKRQDSAEQTKVSALYATWIAQLKSCMQSTSQTQKAQKEQSLKKLQAGVVASQWQGFIDALRSVLIFGKQSPHWQNLAEVFGVKNLAEPAREARLSGLLKAAQAWQGWPAIWCAKAGVDALFNADTLEEARRLAAMPVQSRGCEDLRHLECWTVDGASTLDCDDAFSLEALEGGVLRVWTHIAYPGALLGQTGPLFAVAEQRIASVYHPQQTYPMFPFVLSQKRFSLLVGQACEAISFAFLFGRGKPRLEKACCSVVQVTQNLHYAQGEERIAQESTWGQLARHTQVLAKARFAQGAQQQERHEWHINVENPLDIKMEHVLRQGPIHCMIEELAILTNTHAGNLLRQQGALAVYRAQANQDPQGQFPPAKINLKGGLHAGLACQHYVQITSPIRRFLDMVTQQQLAAVLGGRPTPFADKEQMYQWGLQAERRQQQYRRLAKKVRGAWRCAYLTQQMALKTPFHAVIEVSAGATQETGLVWLEKVGIMAKCTMPAALASGLRIQVQIQEVNEITGHVQVKLSKK